MFIVIPGFVSEPISILVANTIYYQIELHIEFSYFLYITGLRQKPTPGIKPKQISNHQQDGKDLLNYETINITKYRYVI